MVLLKKDSFKIKTSHGFIVSGAHKLDRLIILYIVLSDCLIHISTKRKMIVNFFALLVSVISDVFAVLSVEQICWLRQLRDIVNLIRPKRCN